MKEILKDILAWAVLIIGGGLILSIISVGLWLVLGNH